LTPQSLAFDPAGSAVWVGGSGYLKKLDLSTFTVTATQTVTGTVSSLAASNGQKELVYTLVNNCCTGSSTYAANELNLTSMSTTGTYAHTTASPYAAYTMGGTLPNPATIPHASAVSTQFANGMAASATPNGFVVYDLANHKQIMSGTTPTPVRGIASDGKNSVIYLSLPDSNEYLTVPMPQ